MIAPTARRTAVRLESNRRRRGLAGARCFLLEEANTGVKTGLTLLAEVESGAFDVAHRDFERGAVEGLELTVGVSVDLTPAMLARARAWAIVEDGASSGAIYKADLAGVPAFASEPAWRLRSTGRLAGTYSISTELGAVLVTDTGAMIVTDTGAGLAYA